MQALPVANHARLGERETQEHADREQRDQRVRTAAEDDHQEYRQRAEDHDTVRVGEPEPAMPKLMGQVAVASQDGPSRGKPWSGPTAMHLSRPERHDSAVGGRGWT